MNLSFGQINVLGTPDSIIYSQGLKRIHIMPEKVITLFSCMDYTIHVKQGYQRYIGWSSKKVGSIDNFQIQLESQGDGFFPTLASAEFRIFTKKPIPFWLKEHIFNMHPHILCEVSSDEKEIVLRSKKIDKEIVEIDILPHNNGISISLLQLI